MFVYYGLRGLSLIYLPFADFSFRGLSLFAVFYGLDWIATVPPTLALTNRAFGTQKAPGPVRLDLRQPSVGRRAAAFLAGCVPHRLRLLSRSPLSSPGSSPSALPSSP